jgi:hypothetical protein
VAPRRPYVPFLSRLSLSASRFLILNNYNNNTVVSIFRTLKVRVRSLAEIACFGRQLKWIPPRFL